MKHKNDEIIAALFKKFNLNVEEDLYEKRGGRDGTGKLQYRIIPRRGIDKVEAMTDAKLDWKYTYQSDYRTSIEIWARKYDEDGTVLVEFHTNGEADRENVKQQPVYLDAMALARAKSRAILGIEGFYKHGIMSEQEAEDFEKFSKEQTDITQGLSKIKDGPSAEIDIPEDLNF